MIKKKLKFERVDKLLSNNTNNFQKLVKMLCNASTKFALVDFTGGLYHNQSRDNGERYLHFADLLEKDSGITWAGDLMICYEPVESNALIFLKTVFFASTSCLCPCGCYFLPDSGNLKKRDVEKIKLIIEYLMFNAPTHRTSLEILEKLKKEKLKRFNLIKNSCGIRYYEEIDQKLIQTPSYKEWNGIEP